MWHVQDPQIKGVTPNPSIREKLTKIFSLGWNFDTWVPFWLGSRCLSSGHHVNWENQSQTWAGFTACSRLTAPNELKNKCQQLVWTQRPGLNLSPGEQKRSETRCERQGGGPPRCPRSRLCNTNTVRHQPKNESLLLPDALSVHHYK